MIFVIPCRDIKIDRLARFFAVLFGGCYNNPIFSDEEKRPICSEPFSLQHGARYAGCYNVHCNIVASTNYFFNNCYKEVRLGNELVHAFYFRVVPLCIFFLFLFNSMQFLITRVANQHLFCTGVLLITEY